MNSLLRQHVRESTQELDSCVGLACEESLRVAAAMLGHAPEDEVGATMLVGVLGLDDAAAFRGLVAELADEYGLEATVSLNLGSFTVRFSRPSVPPAPTEPRRRGGWRSVLERARRPRVSA